VCCGGVAEKNPLFMQIYADVLAHPMHIAGSPQTPALGAAIAAAVTAGAATGGYDRFEDAQDRMASLKPQAFLPDPARHRIYDELYTMYRELHDSFGPPSLEASDELRRASGRPRPDFPTLMKRLLALRDRVTTAAATTEMAGA
jgi:L-ribulokinase